MAGRDEFIREITLRICGSLEIKESLHSAFEYLKEHFPLEALILFVIDERLGAVRRIEHVSENVDLPPQIIPLPDRMLQKIAARNFSAPFVVDAAGDEIFRTLAPLLGLNGNTDLIIPLRIKGELLGGLNLRARGEGRYDEELLELAGCLAEPFAIALANALAHEEVLRYQAILLDDKRFLNRELHGGAADGIIGGNTGLRNVMEMVGQVAPLNNTVLILGETGTGKELIATRFISHRRAGMDLSPR
jgi:transcriptional regulator with GAF, ATPase, and Fis domain